ncbi:MAG: hypothetical protein KDE47_13095 [Caldilineaceae bacterium]|nr:hypothetical protein [Caldilineaceae bacterium]
MLFWLGLVAGAIIGWLVEWIIDWQFWRKDVAVSSGEEGRLRNELESASLEIRKLQSQIRQQTPSATAQVSPAANPSTPHLQDSLQDIDGIGQVYAKKLHDAGIHTFGDLSETSIERLTEIINPQEWQTVDFDAWIRQARVFAQNADRGK